MYYIGFDLGDGESCLTCYDSCSPARIPAVIPICQADSFPTAVAMMCETGEIVIGRNALTNAPTIGDLRVCFKRDFKYARNDVYESFRRFVAGVMEQLDRAELPFDFRDPAVCRFVVGQPADWDAAVLARYRKLLESCGIQNPYMVSESRAALVYVNTARFMETYNPAAANTLVCDFGSSTLDFAYCIGGDQDNVQIFGDPRLGGGLMDEQIVLESIKGIRDADARKRAAELFAERSDIHSRLMMSARKIKEQYFLDELHEPLSQRVPVFDPALPAVTVKIDDEILNAVVMYPQPILDNNSIYQQLQEQFTKARNITRENPPTHIVLTGGASRMGFFRDLCADTFRHLGASIIFSDSPDKDIACGLALDGSYLAKLEQLKENLRAFADSEAVEAIVSEEMPKLIQTVSSRVMEALLTDSDSAPGVIRTVFRSWKSDRAPRSLEDLKDSMETRIAAYSRTPEFSAIVEGAVSDWMAVILNRVQDRLDAICLQVGVSPVHVRLKGGRFTEMVDINGGSFQPGTGIINVLDMVVTSITAAIIAVMAGGSGTALVAAGPPGILVGLLIAGALRLIFGNKVRDGIMKLPLLSAVRMLVAESAVFHDHAAEQMKDDLAEQLSAQPELQKQIEKDLSGHIDQVLRAVSCQTKV